MGPTPRKPSARATLRRILRRGVRVGDRRLVLVAGDYGVLKEALRSYVWCQLITGGGCFCVAPHQLRAFARELARLGTRVLRWQP